MKSWYLAQSAAGLWEWWREVLGHGLRSFAPFGFGLGSSPLRALDRGELVSAVGATHLFAFFSGFRSSCFGVWLRQSCGIPCTGPHLLAVLQNTSSPYPCREPRCCYFSWVCSLDLLHAVAHLWSRYSPVDLAFLSASARSLASAFTPGDRRRALQSPGIFQSLWKCGLQVTHLKSENHSHSMGWPRPSTHRWIWYW